MNTIHKKAISLGYPNSKLKVTIVFNSDNSLLAKKLNKNSEATYELKQIVKNGVLIGEIGHLQLIEWNYVKEIH